MKQPAVYMLTNVRNSVFYIGVTSNLIQRVWQHKQKLIDGFTKKYNVHKLVWYELGENMMACIEREKQLKAGSREKKIGLVRQMNPEWTDLYESLTEIASSQSSSQ